SLLGVVRASALGFLLFSRSPFSWHRRRYRRCLAATPGLHLMLPTASTRRRPGAGLSRAALTPDATLTRRRCCATARCWWHWEEVSSARLRAPSCTTRPPGAGLRQIA